MRHVTLFLCLLLSSPQTPTPAVKLAWQPVKNAVVYKLWRAPLVSDAARNFSCAFYVNIGSTTGLWMVDAKVQHGGRYCYGVEAVVNVNGVQRTSPLSDPPAVAIVP